VVAVLVAASAEVEAAVVAASAVVEAEAVAASVVVEAAVVATSAEVEAGVVATSAEVEAAEVEVAVVAVSAEAEAAAVAAIGLMRKEKQISNHANQEKTIKSSQINSKTYPDASFTTVRRVGRAADWEASFESKPLTVLVEAE